MIETAVKILKRRSTVFPVAVWSFGGAFLESPARFEGEKIRLWKDWNKPISVRLDLLQYRMQHMGWSKTLLSGRLFKAFTSQFPYLQNNYDHQQETDRNKGRVREKKLVKTSCAPSIVINMYSTSSGTDTAGKAQIKEERLKCLREWKEGGRAKTSIRPPN